MHLAHLTDQLPTSLLLIGSFSEGLGLSPGRGGFGVLLTLLKTDARHP